MYVMVKPGVQQLNSDIIIVGGDFRKWTLQLCQIYVTVMICTFFNFYQVIKGYIEGFSVYLTTGSWQVEIDTVVK